MPEQRNPWSRGRNERRPNIRLRFAIWLAALAALGVGIWLLSEAFPGRTTSMETMARVVGLVAILAWLTSGFIFGRQFAGRELVRNIGIWVAVAGVLLLGYAYRDDLAQVAARVGGELVPADPAAEADGSVVITAGLDGHFRLYGNVNGTRVLFLVDTGASNVVLSPQDAARAGIDPAGLSYTELYNTANGTGYGAPVRIASLTVGNIRLQDLRASVNQAEMDSSLLGMSFLRQLRSFEFRGDKLYLRP